MPADPKAREREARSAVINGLDECIARAGMGSPPRMGRNSTIAARDATLDGLASYRAAVLARVREVVESFRVPTGDVNTSEAAQNQGYNFALDDMITALGTLAGEAGDA